MHCPSLPPPRELTKRKTECRRWLAKSSRNRDNWMDARNLLHLPVVLLLLAAAFLKAHQLATSPHLANLVFGSRAVESLLIGGEVAIAFGLLSHFGSKWRMAAMHVFIIFLFYSAFRYLSGEDSCGCFGVLEIAPSSTMVLDLVALVSLWFWRPARFALPRRVAAPSAAVIAGILLIPTFQFSIASLSEANIVLGDGVVVLETDEWEGKRLPIEAYIEGGKQYMQGSWNLCLYHENCPKCDEIINNLIEREGAMSTVFVSILPFERSVRDDRPGLIWRQLDPAHKWFVETPLLLEIRDGYVKGLSDQIR